jgi:tetratricopeptide (TPR) repeat protein
MKKPVLFGVGGVILGLIAGFFVSNAINRNAPSKTPPGQPAGAFQPAGNTQPGSAPGGMMPDVAEAIEKAKNEPQNLEAQLKVADMYSQIQRFDKAAEFYERAAALKPNDFTLNIKTAGTYFDARQFENAAKFYEKALEINPKDVDARTDLGTTFVERQTPDIDRGIQEFQKSLKIDPKHEPTLYNMAVAYSKKGDTDSFQKTVARLEAIDPNGKYVSRLRQFGLQK